MGNKDRGDKVKAVELRNLSFKYRISEKPVFENLDLTVDEGSITAVYGNSGSGKSTLCRCLAGLAPRVYKGELSGDALIFGEDITTMTSAQISQLVGIVFQNPTTQLFSPTIEDELVFGPENLCLSREEIGIRLEEMLRLISLQELRYQNPSKLSGGQQQLLAMGSVLMMEPKILICDEIMSWLDVEGRASVKKLILELKSEGKTVIMVDHRMDNIDIADTIFYL